VRRPEYKWIALANTTLGALMATIDSSIVLISLPAIFRGIHMDPLAAGNSTYLLWMMMGYTVVTATLLVTFGRISDMFGRVRMYNLGFLIFTIGSILLSVVPGTGTAAATQLIIYRVIQGIGGGFLMSNSTAILIDAFPVNERGRALGINQIAAIGGSVLGLLLGGFLADLHWRWVFLISVPVGIAGTIWAYTMLKEVAVIRKDQKLDWPGNITFAVGLTVLLLGITNGIMPYGASSMGWGNPKVIASIVGGIALLIAFVFIELRSADPMFRIELFKIRMFTAGNISGFLASLGRGGLNFMLVIWLQGIWLPLHGYRFEDTPLWSAIYMLPLMIGFLVSGPVGGALSDKYGARAFSTIGMLLNAVGFVGLAMLPADFNYVTFATLLLLMGIGMGLFAAPNTASIMNAVPPHTRGVSSGMRATFQNTANTFSMGIFFSIVIAGLSGSLGSTLFSGLTQAGVPAAVAQGVAKLPPVGALFAAFLGYNPMGALIPAQVQQVMPAAAVAKVTGNQFFPNLISPPFMVGLKWAFAISAVLSLIAAAASALRGERQIHESEALGAGPALEPAGEMPD
jgi:EmrB/QacA subfamily drug resistance transporter